MKFKVNSRRYFDRSDVEKQQQQDAKPMVHTIVFEGMITPDQKKLIIESFYKHYSDRKVVFVPGIQQPPTTQMHPVEFFTQMTNLAIDWINNEVEPHIQAGSLVLLDQYFHRYEAMLLLFEMQQAQRQMQIKIQQMKERGEKIPEQSPIDVNMHTVNELKKITAKVKRPDIMFALFDSADQRSASGRQAFMDLFGNEKYMFPLNTFYKTEDVIKEMVVRLKNYDLSGSCATVTKK